MKDLDNRLKKLEAVYTTGKVYIFEPSEMIPENYSREQLVKIPGEWRSTKGVIPPPVLAKDDYVIIDSIGSICDARAKDQTN